MIGFPRGALDDARTRTHVQWAPRIRGLDRIEIAGKGLASYNRRMLQATFGRVLVLR